MKSVRVFLPLSLVLACGSADENPYVRGARGGEDPAAGSAASASVPLRRLSRIEYTNTIGDLVALASPADAAAIRAALAPTLARMPDDTRVTVDGQPRGGFKRLDQALQQTHADIAYAVANEVGAALTSSPARLTAAFGPCITDADTANDDACVTTFLRGFGERVLRRAVTDDDVAFYKRPLEGGPASPAALADVIALLFSAPDVLYIVERAGGTDDASRPVGPYELASRLSYHFWQTLPDDELFTLARNGELSKDDVYAAQVDRSAASPRARGPLDTFFAEWLRLDELDRLDTRIGDPVFDAFVGGDVPTMALREHMFADVLDAAAWETSHGGTVRSLLENRRSFARTPELAAIYKVPVWDGASEPPTFAEPARAGLVTRAAFLATGSANTRPIMKGVRLRMGLLCDSVPPPPPSAANTHVDLSPTLTTRQVVEQLTQGEGSVCAGCHTKEINPLGFATENFDALGRFRTTQRLFDGAGIAIGEPAIDTATTPHIVRKDDRVARDAVELTSYIAESHKVEGCFARNYFRYTFARNETAGDEPVIEELATAASSGSSIAEVMKSVARRREFRMKITSEGGTGGGAPLPSSQGQEKKEGM